MCKTSLIAIAATLLMAGSLNAGQATYNLDQDPSNTLKMYTTDASGSPWRSGGGNSGGYLSITDSENSMYSAILFPDIDQGKPVVAFTFACDVRIGNAVGNGGRPADGFSISYARSNDPVLVRAAEDPTADLRPSFAVSGAPENGTSTGIAIGFDTWSGNTLPDGPDLEGIIVRVDNKTVLRQPMPTRNGACGDVTSLQTGSYNADSNGDPSGLCWQKLEVSLAQDGKLTVKYKGSTRLDNFQTSYFPSPGRLVIAGRTGGANENHHVDNINITTVAVTDSQAPTVPQSVTVAGVSTRRIALSWSAASDDSGKVAYEVERDGTVITALPITESKFLDSGLKPNTSYSYKVRAVDPASNKSAFSSAVTAKTEVENLALTPGFVTFEAYTGISGNPVQNLLDSPKYPDAPDIVAFASAMDSRIVFPTDGNEAYGGRMRGWFTPKESGQYEFFVRSDDASQLFLSPDDNVNGLAVAAEETGCCGAFEESGAPETSAPIALTAGRRYAIQVLWKEGTGGDFAQVAFRKVGDTTPAGQLRPISSEYLSTNLDPDHGVPVIKDQPKGQTVAAGSSVTLSVSALGKTPLTYQWKLKGNDIPGATNPTLTVSNIRGTDAGDYTVVVSNFEGSTTSQAATLVITGVPTILFLVGNAAPTLNVADTAVKARLESQGWQVVVKGALASATSDADGKQLIISSSTIPSGDVGNKFQLAPVPMINWEEALQDNLLLTTDESGTTRGTTGGQTDINIVKADHPLAAGLSAGKKTVLRAADTFSWGVPNNNAVVIATIADDPTHAVIYAYEKGAKLIDDTTPAPARRVHFMMTDNPFTSLNPDGLKLFDAAVNWAAEIKVQPPAQAPTLSVSRTATGLSITFTGSLQSADSVTGPWTDVANATSPLAVTTAAGAKFYRAKQ
ncbi:MAG: immunoglobulin domain-containing protein [Verrucomicrobia bacterium]|nr:immunoglobulin domain-containing protein [Verrucomicrobiota bacterium]